MIKKKIFIIFLSYLLFSCSNKKELALQNCSDNIYVQSYPEDILKDDVAYQILDKDRLELFKKRNKYWGELGEHEKRKGYSSDPKLRQLKQKWIKDKIDENWRELKNYQKEIGYDDDEERKRLSDMWLSSRKELDKKYTELNEYKTAKSKEIFIIIKFDSKIRINNYYKIYQNCERELKITPTAFLKKWGK